MLVHGYSQIPVVDPAGKPMGVLDEVGVMQILTRTPEWLEKSTQWVMGLSLPVVEGNRGAKEVLDFLLGGWPAVLIQNGHGLQGIVTKSDLLHRFVQVDAPEYVI
jgi:predicted transcriptional regulator